MSMSTNMITSKTKNKKIHNNKNPNNRSSSKKKMRRVPITNRTPKRHRLQRLKSRYSRSDRQLMCGRWDCLAGETGFFDARPVAEE